MDGVEVEGTAARVISCWRSLMSAGSEGLLKSGRLMSGVSGGVLTGVIVLTEGETGISTMSGADNGPGADDG